MMQACRNCVFSRPLEAPPTPYECRRLPPVHPDRTAPYGRQPTVRPDDWCGEWKPATLEEKAA